MRFTGTVDIENVDRLVIKNTNKDVFILLAGQEFPDMISCRALTYEQPYHNLTSTNDAIRYLNDPDILSWVPLFNMRDVCEEVLT